MENEKSYSGFIFVHFNSDNAILMVLTSTIQSSIKSITFFGVDPEFPFRLSYFIFRRDFFLKTWICLFKKPQSWKEWVKKNFFLLTCKLREMETGPFPFITYITKLAIWRPNFGPYIGHFCIQETFKGCWRILLG